MAKEDKIVRKVPLSGTRVIREGKRIRPAIGVPFDYTAGEIEQLTAAGAKFRNPNDESRTAEEAAAAASGGKASSAEKSQAGAKDGKKAATANKSDGEAAGNASGGDADDDL